MKGIRHDFAIYDFKAWLAQLTQRVEQMHLPRRYAIERIATWRAYSRRDIHHGKQYVKRSPMRESVSQGYRKSTGQALNWNVLPQPAIALSTSVLSAAFNCTRSNRGELQDVLGKPLAGRV